MAVDSKDGVIARRGSVHGMYCIKTAIIPRLRSRSSSASSGMLGLKRTAGVSLDSEIASISAKRLTGVTDTV